jgi:hypothetical protein
MKDRTDRDRRDRGGLFAGAGAYAGFTAGAVASGGERLRSEESRLPLWISGSPIAICRRRRSDRDHRNRPVRTRTPGGVGAGEGNLPGYPIGLRFPGAGLDCSGWSMAVASWNRRCILKPSRRASAFPFRDRWDCTPQRQFAGPLACS